MEKHTHTTHQPTTTTTPTYLVTTGVGTEFVWKYKRVLGVTHDRYERRLPAGRSGGVWDEIEPRQPRYGTLCPTHRIARTPSGRCDECD